MPFDGFSDREIPSPLDVQLLDRTRQLICTADRWVQREFSRHTARGHLGYCLYGALFVAEDELTHELPFIHNKASFIKCIDHPNLARYRNTAFYRVHQALNSEARPWIGILSKDQTFAMHLNDGALSVEAVHRLIDRARTRILKRHQQRSVGA